MALIVPLWLLALPATAMAQHGGGGHGGGGPGGGGGSSHAGGGVRSGATGASSARAIPRSSYPIVGPAVPRPGGLPYRGGSGIGPGGYYGGFAPWAAFGGLGFYGGYWGGYDSWLEPWADPWYGGYGSYPPGAYSTGEEGAIHLKVTPRDAMVYVDGYYVGVVDDYDGVFQRLHLDAGPHRIEIRAAGYTPLSFNLMTRPNQTTTYRGALTTAP